MPTPAYVPRESSPVEPTLRHPDPQHIGDGRILSGTGAPDVSIGDNGDYYVDLSTGDTYIKTGDTWNVWAPDSATTISTAEVWAASGNPAHTPTIDRQIYINTDDGSEWKWYSSAWH